MPGSKIGLVCQNVREVLDPLGPAEVLGARHRVGHAQLRELLPDEGEAQAEGGAAPRVAMQRERAANDSLDAGGHGAVVEEPSGVDIRLDFFDRRHPSRDGGRTDPGDLGLLSRHHFRIAHDAEPESLRVVHCSAWQIERATLLLGEPIVVVQVLQDRVLVPQPQRLVGRVGIQLHECLVHHIHTVSRRGRKLLRWVNPDHLVQQHHRQH
mmetsp:Transcript_166903/g.535764  ORF Transcript_166903/g.535764 Transcript_166903/m.535764 type:complete len:210 (+) Transcript_166903:1541-2170(+)